MRSMFTNGRYANVTATLALVVALGGTSYAAVTITGANVRNNTITGADIKNGSIRGADIAGNTITSGKIRNDSLLSRDFKAGQLPAGAAGPAGPAGPSGATNVVVRFAYTPGDVAAGTRAAVAVACALGERAISGGTTDPSGAFDIWDSAPTGGVGTPGVAATANPSGWRVEATNVSGLPNRLSAYVVCAGP
jgi:uncharacterized protein YjbI with pentapeptide repeats